MKCITCLTSKNYTEEFLYFNRDEKERKNNVMTSARNQPFYKKHNFTIGCFDGSSIKARITAERNIAFYIYRKIIPV